jgi:hypothetical protein
VSDAPPAGGASPLARSGEDADHFADRPAGEIVQDCRKKTWVAIELKTNRGRPVAGEEYRIELPDGRIVTGVLDALGTAGVEVTDPGTCKISFPNLDAKSWKKGDIAPQ